ncbi:MAG: InlB B-repeat-containing protein [Clostridia bacterium]|nr:InlB B-repeat-containing protein [Clostridia bacterium]
MVMVVTMLPAISITLTERARADVWDGTYTDASGFLENISAFGITDENAFAYFAKTVTAGTTYAGMTVSLEADLDMGNVDFEGIGETGHAFEGTFEGNGHTISNVKNPKTAAAGLFNAVVGGAVIQNLNLENVQVTDPTNSKHAALIGNAQAGSVASTPVKVQNCTVTTADIKGIDNTAALIGICSAPLTMADCSASGVTVTATGAHIGGLVGYLNKAATFTNCSFQGDVASSSGSQVGGMIGSSCYAGTVTITDCQVSGGPIKGASQVGGFIGLAESILKISNGTCAVKVTGTGCDVGGFVGLLQNSNAASEQKAATFNNCHYTGTSVTSAAQVGGILGAGYQQRYWIEFINCSTGSNTEIIATGGRAGGICGCGDLTCLRFTDCSNYAAVKSLDAGTYHDAGGMVGSTANQWDTAFTRCYNFGDITAGQDAGGIAGFLGNQCPNKFNRCFNFGSVTSSNGDAGGMLGDIHDDALEKGTEFTNCANFGAVTVGQSGDCAAGIFGEGWGTYAYNCFNFGHIKNNRRGSCSSSSYYGGGTGGILGHLGYANYCYNAGTIDGFYSYYTGGVLGWNNGATRSYNRGTVNNGNQIGGRGSFSNCYNSNQTITPATLSESVFVADTWGVNAGWPIHRWWRDEYFRFPIVFMDGFDTVKELKTYNYDEDLVMPNPTKEGYVFDGWYTEPEGGTKIGNAGDTYRVGINAPTNTMAMKTTTSAHRPYVECETITFYAHFTEKVTAVTLNGNGADIMGTAAVTVSFDAAMPGIVTPQKTGYTFLGYYDEPTGGVQYYNADGTSAKNWDLDEPTATLYAHWLANGDTPFMVEHYYMRTDGGWNSYPDVTDTTMSGETGAELLHADLANTPTWFIYNAGKSGVKSTINGDGSTVVKLYYDREKINVTFKNYDGTVIETQQVYYGANAAAPAMAQYLKKDLSQHYRFISWTPSDYNPITAGPVTVTAQYVPEEHNWGEKVWTRLATCTDGGEYTMTCDDCGQNKTVSPTSTGHDLHYVDCGNGTHRIYCTRGDYELYEPHTFVDGVCVCGATESAGSLTVTFKDWQGEVIQTITNVPAGSTPMYTGGNAALKRESTAAADYEFDKWVQEDDNTKLLGPVDADTVYVPVYTETARLYTVIFLNWNGDVLAEEQVPYGTSALALAPTASKEDGRHTYAFTGWLPDLSSITKTTYAVAQFEATDAANWTVTFTDGDGTTLYTTKVADGEAAVYPFDAPEKEGYTFYCWDKDLSRVRYDLTVNALFVPDGGDMVGVTFVNYDNRFLKADVIAKGATAVYDLADPVRPEDGTYAYTFTGWDNALENVQENTVFTAQFEAQAAHTHTFVYVPQQDAVCDAAGLLAHYVCDDCGRLFDGDYNEVSVTDLTIPALNHRNKTYVAAAAATCVAPGAIAHWYCPDCGKRAADEAFGSIVEDVSTSIDLVNGHRWAAITYAWSDDYAFVTATRACLLDADHNVTETVETTYAEVTPATLTANGEGRYTATFTNPIFTAQTQTVEIPNLDPDWYAPTYVWSDDYATCTATRVNRIDPEIKETETADGVYGVVTPAACGAAGEAAYTATFENPVFAAQTHSVILEALTHSYSAPIYTWSDDHKTVTASMTCSNCGDVVTETVTAGETVITPATVEAEGESTFTAVFTNPAFETQTVTAPTDKLDPAWGEPTYVWNEDHTECTATRVSTTDPTVSKTETATATYEVTLSPTCHSKGLGVYTVTFANEGLGSASVTVELPATGAHVWGTDVTYTWNADHTLCTATVHCVNEGCPATLSETAAATYVDTTPATETTEGVREYTVTFEDERFGTHTYVGVAPVLPHGYGEVITKHVKFVAFPRMHYRIDDEGGQYFDVYNSTTVEWVSARPLRFKVMRNQNFAFDDAVIYMNGVELQKDPDGWYTLPKNADSVTISAAGYVNDAASSTGKKSIWDTILQLLNRIISIFKAIGKK